MGKESTNIKEWRYVYIYVCVCVHACVCINTLTYIYMIYFAVYMKLTQHCKSTIVQLKKAKDSLEMLHQQL